MLIEHNLVATPGSYCMYLGHTTSMREQPNTNFKVRDKYFSKTLNPKCGLYGAVASISQVPSNIFDDNYFVEPDQTDGRLEIVGPEIPAPWVE